MAMHFDESKFINESGIGISNAFRYLGEFDDCVLVATSGGRSGEFLLLATLIIFVCHDDGDCI